MKNQYFGDQTDYIKYGILRFFARRAEFDLGVHWTLTLDDGSSDGRRNGYISHPSEWRSYDADIFDKIRTQLLANTRDLRVVEQLEFLPGVQFCFDQWTSSPSERNASIETFLKRLRPNSLVFLDPDNGIEVSSAPRGSSASSKYVYLDELAAVWGAGHSVAVYQHFPRVKRIPYLSSLASRVCRGIEPATILAIVTSHVAFVFCLQDEHVEAAMGAATAASAHWAPHTMAYQIDRDFSLKLIGERTQGELTLWP